VIWKFYKYWPKFGSGDQKFYKYWPKFGLGDQKFYKYWPKFVAKFLIITLAWYDRGICVVIIFEECMGAHLG